MKSSTAAGRRYVKRFVPTMLAYVVALFASVWALKHYHPDGLALVALSILPALPIIAIVVVMGLYLLEEQDEYLRARIVTAMLGGLALMLSITSAWGFMEEAGVLPHMPAYFAFILWCAGMGLTQCAMGLRDRVRGGAGE